MFTNIYIHILLSVLISVSIGNMQLYSMQHEFTTPILHLRQLLETKNDKQYQDSLNQLVQLLKLQNVQVKAVVRFVRAVEREREISKQGKQLGVTVEDNNYPNGTLIKETFNSSNAVALALRFIRFLKVSATEIYASPDLYFQDQQLVQELEQIVNTQTVDSEAQLFALSMLNIHRENEAMRELALATENLIDVLLASLRLYAPDIVHNVNLNALTLQEKYSLIAIGYKRQIASFKNKFIQQCASRGYTITKDCCKYLNRLIYNDKQGQFVKEHTSYDKKCLDALKNVCQNYYDNEQSRLDNLYTQADAELTSLIVAESNVNNTNDSRVENIPLHPVHKKKKKKKASPAIAIAHTENTEQHTEVTQPNQIDIIDIKPSTKTVQQKIGSTNVRNYNIALSVITWVTNPQQAFAEHGYEYRNEQNFNYIVQIHTLPLALIDLAFEKGYILHDERGTTALLAGELHIPGQKARIGVYSAGKNLIRNTVYHHCFSSKPSAYGLVEEFFNKSKWDIDYPPLMPNNESYEKIANTLSLMDDSNWVIKSEDRYLITFYNKVTGVHFLVYKTRS